MNFVRYILQNHTQVLELTLEHLWLVGISTALAIAIGVPLGILIAHRPRFNKPVLVSANIIQTIPSLALFGFLLPVPWLGSRSDRLAIVALTLYALLPIIRNTFTGIRGVDPAVRGSGAGNGTDGISTVVSSRVAAGDERDSFGDSCCDCHFSGIGDDCGGDRGRGSGRIHLPRIGDGGRPRDSCWSGSSCNPGPDR